MNNLDIKIGHFTKEEVMKATNNISYGKAVGLDEIPEEVWKLDDNVIQYITGVSVFGTRVRIRTPCVIIRTPYIPLNKLYIIDESKR